MPLDFRCRVHAQPDVLMQNLKEEAVFLNMRDESYYGLDSVGNRFWQALTTHDTIEEAYQKLLAEFEVDAERLKTDLEQLVSQLHEAGLIEIVAP